MYSMGVEDEGDLFTRDVSASILAQVKENIRKQRGERPEGFHFGKGQNSRKEGKGPHLDLDLKLNVDLNLEFEEGREVVASRASRPVFSSRAYAQCEGVL